VNEDDIRAYAYHLFVQGGGIPDRDLDNWLEAKACLNACIPMSESHIRLHHQSRTEKAYATKGAKVRAA
jgi:hypothetical protein